MTGLPPDVERAWSEARASSGAGAFTAAEMVCRKILMHVAVDKAGGAEGKHFIEYLQDLETQHPICSSMNALVKVVYDRGNIANHLLPASEVDDVRRTMAITEHLLRDVYEMQQHLPPVSE